MGISLSAIQLLVSTTSLLIDRVQVAMSSQTKSVEEKPIAPEEAKKAPAIKKAKKAVKTAPTGEKTPSYQEMVKQAVVETKSRTGSSLITVKKFAGRQEGRPQLQDRAAREGRQEGRTG